MKNKILYLTINETMHTSKYKTHTCIWSKLGYSSEYYNFIPSISNYFSLIKKILKSNVIYIRNCGWRYWVLVYPFLLTKKVIIEIQTPVSNVKEEIKLSKMSAIKKIYAMFLIKYFLFLTLPIADLIIEMAEEHDDLVLKYKQKIFMWQNGILDINFYNIPDSYFKSHQLMVERFISNNEFRCIMVSNLAPYHGLDRVIEALKEYYLQDNITVTVFLDIIAKENEELERVKELVNSMGLSPYVRFIGFVNMVDLASYYLNSNIAMGSLAFDRINLKSGSTLKLREYTLFGLPSVINYFDYDLSVTEFVFEYQTNDCKIDMNEILIFYRNLIKRYGVDLSSVIHKYAINNLLWEHKIKSLEIECKKREIL